MKLADRHGRPLSQVMSEYPAWELPYWAVWMSRVPSEGDRLEWQLACFRSQWMSANSKKGANVPKPHELVMVDWFTQKHEAVAKKKQQDDISAMIQAFSSVGLSVNKAKPQGDYLGD